VHDESRDSQCSISFSISVFLFFFFLDFAPKCQARSVIDNDFIL